MPKIIELGDTGKKYDAEQLEVRELLSEEIADLLEVVDSIDFSEIQKSWRSVIKKNKYLMFKLLALVFKKDEQLFRKLPISKLHEVLDALWNENEVISKNLPRILSSQISMFVMGFMAEAQKNKADLQQQTFGNA